MRFLHFYRDIRFIQAVLQIAFVLVVIFFTFVFWNNMLQGLSAIGRALELPIFSSNETTALWLWLTGLGLVVGLAVGLMLWWRKKRRSEWKRVVNWTLLGGLIAAIAAGVGLWATMDLGPFSVDLQFFEEPARFDIPPESLAFKNTDPYAYAFVVGLINTVKVAMVGIVLTTLLGTFVGISRLSSNWLISRIALSYVEIFRNIPLLVQLIFWYFAVMVNLPAVREAIDVFGAKLSQRGLYLPWPFPTETFPTWAVYLGIGLVLAVLVYVARRWQLKRADRPGLPGGWAFVTFAVFAVVSWFLQSSAPLYVDAPVLERFNFVGGLQLSTEFSALLIGLVVYTASFIAEIVRAGIQSVSKGQVEAARALGLRSGKVLRLVVLPQALRVIVPPMTSQYLNLTKNSSLAIAIGYFDVTRVANTTINQSGHGVEGIAALMAAYLVLSLIISFFMNQLNKRIRLVER